MNGNWLHLKLDRKVKLLNLTMIIDSFLTFHNINLQIILYNVLLYHVSLNEYWIHESDTVTFMCVSLLEEWMNPALHFK